MKKSYHFYFFFLLIGLFFSCSEDKALEYDAEESSSLRTAGDGNYDILGYGYNITKPYVSDQSIGSYQIIDVQKLIASEPVGSVYYDRPYLGNITQRTFAGESFYKYVEEVITKTSFSGSVASNGLTTAATKGMFSADVKLSQERGYKHSYSSTYSYATAEVIKQHRRLFIDTNLDILRKYPTAFFQQELGKVTTASGAYEFVKKFGTHVLFDITIGGEFKSEFKSLLVEEDSYTSKKSNAEGSAKFILTKIGLGATVGWDQQSSQQMVEKNLNWKNNLTSRGGTTNGVSITTNPIQGTTYTIGVGTWAASVDDKTSRLVGLDWNKTYPIYELITDLTKKQLVKNAVNQFLVDNTPEKIETKPLHRYWNRKYLMFYPTITYGEARMTSDWKYEGIIGYPLKVRETGSAPLYRYWNSKYKMFYLTPTYGEARMTSDWTYEGIMGYAYTSQKPNTVPLYRYWNQKYLMFYFTTVYAESRMTNDWKYEGILGYIYPSDVPCIDRDKFPNNKPVPKVMD